MPIEGVGAQIALGWFHRYPARFPLSLVESLLSDLPEVLGLREPTVLDPFAGTGTVLATARQYGFGSVGVELSTLGVEIARLRLDPPHDPSGLIEVTEGWAGMSQRQYASLPRPLCRWLGPRNARRVARYLRELEGIPGIRERRFLTLALSSALRPSSRWLSGSIKPQVDPSREPPPIETNLVRLARILARDCALEAPGKEAPSAVVLKADSCNLPLPSLKMDAIVTSPPYFQMYDYFDVQRLSYLAFGWPVERSLQVGRRHYISPDGVGFRPPRGFGVWYRDRLGAEVSPLGRALRNYVQQIRIAMGECHRVLKSDGVIRLAVGDSIRQRRVFPLAALFAEILAEVGFRDIQMNPRKESHRRILPAGRDPDTGRFSSAHSGMVRERIVSARKE